MGAEPRVFVRKSAENEYEVRPAGPAHPASTSLPGSGESVRVGFQACGLGA
jgi:hypothetical protein